MTIELLRSSSSLTTRPKKSFITWKSSFFAGINASSLCLWFLKTEKTNLCVSIYFLFIFCFSSCLIVQRRASVYYSVSKEVSYQRENKYDKHIARREKQREERILEYDLDLRTINETQTRSFNFLLCIETTWRSWCSLWIVKYIQRRHHKAKIRKKTSKFVSN